jgi:DNA mismatch endonuclease (patch repair protein)
VFDDGCFWHSCPQHRTKPATHRNYLSSNLDRNRWRDAVVDKTLSSAGSKVVRIWEHSALPDAVETVVESLRDMEGR